jgi:hypothetical protein
MSFYMSKCRRFYFFSFDFVCVLRLFLIVVVGGLKKRRLYYVRNVCAYLLIC